MTDYATVYVIRHGQSIGNIQRRISRTRYGELQSPLTELGKKQANELANKLVDLDFEAIFSSDLNRARETAEIIAKKNKKKVITESSIRERYWGNNGRNFTKDAREEIEKGLEALNDEEKLLHRYFPDGETAMEAVNRFLAFLKKIIPNYKGKTIMVVNHGNIMRSFLIHIKWAKFDDLPPGTIENTGYFVLETNGKTFHIKDTHGVNKKI